MEHKNNNKFGKDKIPNLSKSMWKSILIGGMAAGAISMVPFINLFNLFFMMWMGFGGGLSVYLFRRDLHLQGITTPIALLTGALSGALGCSVLGVFVYATLSSISPEKFQRSIAMLRDIIPGIEEEYAVLFQDNNLTVLTLTVILIMMVISIISGALGGLIAKGFSSPSDDDEDDDR